MIFYFLVINILIKGLQRVSLIEYPGKIVSIVFVGNCNFSCHYCYNPDLVKDYDKIPTIPEEEIINFMKKRKGLLDGICITGGEPTIYPDLPKFIKKIKNLGFLVKLDTNGTNPDILKDLIDQKLIDYVAMDIKASLSKYEKVTGTKVNLDNIQKSVNIIRKSGIDYEFRTTVVPKFFKKKDALDISEWLKGSERYFLQQFRPEKTLNEDFKNLKPYPKEKLELFTDMIKPHFKFSAVRGI